MNIYKKIHSILNNSQRNFFITMFFLMLIGMVFETFGIAMIFPILVVITKDGIIDTYPIIGSIMNSLGVEPSRRSIVIFGVLLMIAIYTIKTVYLLFLTYKQNKFTASLTVDISKTFFSGYMYQPYSFHIQRNSAELIQNTKDEVFGFVATLASIMSLMSEVLVIIGLGILLSFIEPYAFLVMSIVLIGVSSIYYIATRKLLSKWGAIRMEHNVLSLKNLQQGLGGVKDIKLLGRESLFIDNYEYHMSQRARVGIFYGIVQSLPRSLLELMMVVGMGIVVLVTMVSEGRAIESIIPSLGVFAMAAFRIMPSLNKIIGSLQVLRFNLPMLEKLYSEVKLFNNLPETHEKKLATFKKEIKISNLDFTYQGASNYSLSGLNISIPVGKSIGFIGPSGAGKTTLIDIILGLLKPTNGKIYVDGKDMQNNTREWQNLIGYIPQDIFLTDDTLSNNIALGITEDEINDDWLREAIDKSELRELIESLPNKLDTVVGEHGVKLSGGQRQRIGIARALYHRPAVIVLDEATSSLDNKTESSVMNSINALHGSKTIIIITHRLSTIKYCDYVYKLDKGKIIQHGDYKSVVSDA
jgi:ABC-type bacteriocin/lantibiotic exporter with double-glycine peptidase domain